MMRILIQECEIRFLTVKIHKFLGFIQKQNIINNSPTNGNVDKSKQVMKRSDGTVPKHVSHSCIQTPWCWGDLRKSLIEL